MFYVYLLTLKDKSIYVGYSSDLKSRIATHQGGSVSSTKNLRPLQLSFYAAFSSKEKAAAFEKYLKTGAGFAFRTKHFL